PRDHQRAHDLRTWLQLVNLALIITPPSLLPRKETQDWSNPRGYEADWRRSWEWSYNLNLIGQDQLPFRQSDWPTPRDYERAIQLRTWIDQVKYAIVKPFNQQDWPNPTPFAREPTLNTWARGYNLNLIGKDQLPTGAQSTDLAPRDYQRLLQTWISSVN